MNRGERVLDLVATAIVPHAPRLASTERAVTIGEAVCDLIAAAITMSVGMCALEDHPTPAAEGLDFLHENIERMLGELSRSNPTVAEQVKVITRAAIDEVVSNPNAWRRA